MKKELSSMILACAGVMLVCTDNGCSSNARDRADADAGGQPEGSASSGKGLRNVDLTIVFPLPDAAAPDGLLAATAAGRGGALLERSVFADTSVPELDERAPLADDAARLDALRVVAVRVDPCPGVVMPPVDAAACQPQLRLVFQSMFSDGKKTLARDGALHAFYRLSSSDFDLVLTELRQLRAMHAADAPTPLGIHPVIRAEGLLGPYASRVRALVTQFCGEPNLVRVTNFRRIASERPEWDFALRERPDGQWSDRPIPTTDRASESLVTIVGGRWDAVIDPAVSHPDDPTRVFRVQTAEEQGAFAAVGRLLDPRSLSSESVDCASCHIAPDVAQFGVSVRGLSLASFRSTYPLDVAARSDAEAIGFENIHMMSYLGDSFSVAPRVANETAAILELLEDR